MPATSSVPRSYYQYTTIVRTADGKLWDLGKHDYPPTHFHDNDARGHCIECLVINAWPEVIGESNPKSWLFR